MSENTPENLPPAPHAIRTFGRRLGRPLKNERKQALSKLSSIEIPTRILENPDVLDPRTLFQNPIEKIWFEIGFGSGEHLLARIQQSPQDGFIGAEPYINGMAMFLKNLPDNSVPAVRVYMDDALHVISKLKDNSLDGLYILNPDPWPKKRHHKRRIINPENLNQFSRVLKSGGHLIFSTDVAELAEWTREQIAPRPDFKITPESESAPQTPPPGWPLTTRYMSWGVSEGRIPHYFTYIRQ